MFESNLIFKLLMLYRKKELNKKKEKKMKLFEKTLEYNIEPKKFDFKIYFENKTNKKKIMDSDLQKELDYDMSYLENTLKRVQLEILIILFIITVFKVVPLNLLDDLNSYQGDIINVLTIYTLIMLYMDKSREWK